MVVFWAADLQGSHESLYLLLTLNLVFSMLVCLFVAYLITRSFLASGKPGLLLLGCGVVIWGPAGAVATAAARGDANISITIYNSCIWLSGLCHLAGVSLSLRSRRSLSPPALWLPAGYALAAGAVMLVTLSALAGWIPTFFVEDRGTTPMCQIVLGSAVAMFSLTALLLGTASRRNMSAFAYWYALALMLIAAGLFGVMLQSYHASILGWTGRATQSLGGLYMLIAAVASVRESHGWEISLETALRKSEERYRLLFTNMSEAFFLGEVICDEQGKPCDYRCREVNPAFEVVTGIKRGQILGRTLRELSPNPGPAVIEKIGEVALSGRPRHFEVFSQLLGKHFDVYAFAPERGTFGAVFMDITERKRAQEALRDANENLRVQAEQLQSVNEMLQTRQAELEEANEGLRMQERELQDQAEALRESEERYRTLFETAPDAIVVHRDGRILYANDMALCLTGADSVEQLAHRTVLDFFRLDEREQAVERMRMAMAGERLPVREGTLLRLGGQEVAVEFHTAPVDFQGVRAILTIIHDISERRRVEETRKTLADQREMELAGMRRLQEVSMLLLREGQPDTLYEQILEAAIALMRSDMGSMQMLDPEHGVLRLLAWKGFQAKSAALWESVRMDSGSSCAEALRCGRRVVVPDVERCDFIAGTPDLDAYRWSEIRSVQSTPLVSRSARPLGMISTHWRRPYEPPDGDLRLLDVLARQAADLLERVLAEQALRELNATLESKVAQRTAELEQRARQLQELTLELTLAEEHERRRIALVLHEDLQQQIAGAKFHLNLLKTRARDDPVQQAIAGKVDEILKEAIEKARSLSHELSPAVLHMNDLAEALHWLANEVRAKHDLTVHVDVSREATVPPEALGVFLFRAAQEMLFNALKHARVHEAGIRVRRIRQYVCLCVSDQGCGFDPQEPQATSGLGLLSIRERVELLGGRMKIKSVEGRGRRFQIVVPDGRKS